MARSSANGGELSPRKKMILKAVIEAYIRCGEPVGSKFLTQNLQIALSPATIRNEMAELESMGYLIQPHTSAGRIPTEYGYRFYVNSLMQRQPLSDVERRELDSMAQHRLTELDKVLDRATKLISELTNYTSIAVKPKQTSIVITHFKVVSMAPEVFLLIMITNVDVVRTRHIHVNSSLNDALLQRLELALNYYVAGKTPDSITLPQIMEIEHALPGCESLVNPIIKCVYEVISELDSGDLKVDGVNRLLQYPEYSDIGEFQGLLGLLENKNDILDLVSNSEKDRINVMIGSENNVDVMHNSSLVFKTVTSGGRVIGAIGVIGPCRMDYSKVITALEQLAHSIESVAEYRSLPQPGEQTEGGLIEKTSSQFEKAEESGAARNQKKGTDDGERGR